MVKRTKKEEKTKGGVIIPHSCREDEKTGVVVKITNLRNPDYLPGLGVGSKLIFGRWQKTIEIDGQEYLIMDEQDILYYEPSFYDGSKADIYHLDEMAHTENNDVVEKHLEVKKIIDGN